MSDSRTKNSIRNIIWGIIQRVILIVIPFINKTIIIHSIGIEYAGVADLFTSILSVLNMAELGINSAILFSMYGSISKNDVKKTNALLNFYRKAYVVIGSVILGAGLLLCFKINVFITGDIPADLNIYILFIMFLLNTVSSYFFFAYMSIILTANQREDVSYRANTVVQIVKGIAGIIVLAGLKSYYLYVILGLIATVIYNIIVYTSARRMFPQYRCEGRIGKETKGLLKKQIAGMLLAKLSIVSRNSFDSIVISAFLGLTSVAVYNNYYYIMNSVYVLIIHFCSGIRASIGNKVATKSVEENYNDMLSFSYAFYFIYGICTVIMLCLYQPFMRLWAGEEYTESNLLAILMSFYFFIVCSYGIISQYWETAGLFWENRTRYVCEAAINLALNLLLIRFWGLSGIILATIVSMFFSTNILGPKIAFKHYFVGCSIKRYFQNQLNYLIVTAIACVFAYIICSHISLEGIPGLAVRLVISAAVAVIIHICIFSRTEHFDDMLDRASSIVRLPKEKLPPIKNILGKVCTVLTGGIAVLSAALLAF